MGVISVVTHKIKLKSRDNRARDRLDLVLQYTAQNPLKLRNIF